MKTTVIFGLLLGIFILLSQAWYSKHLDQQRSAQCREIFDSFELQSMSAMLRKDTVESMRVQKEYRDFKDHLIEKYIIKNK